MSYKVEAWPWCADYCKKNKHSPYDSYFWDKAMLEYRRQHNIFEVGDYYAYLYEWDSDLNIVCKYNPSEWSDHLWNIKNMIRHATPEEIAVGHRL